MTRARSRLVITRAQSRTLFGQARAGEPSRFLAEAGRRVRHFRIGQTKAALAAEPPKLTTVRDGQRVVHPRYGLGLVTRFEPGAKPMVSVRFDDGNERRLALEYARLQPA
jgi:DNA helicase-2/ATP-dependent DNA helicase PcrA